MNAHVFFVPHPPIIINAIGQGKELTAQKTIDGMDKIAKEIGFLKPDTIIFISPHGTTFKDATSLLYEDVVEGSFEKFGYRNITNSKKINKTLTKMIGDFMDVEKINNVFLDNLVSGVYQCDVALDHGVLVPMHFIDHYYTDYDIVHICPSHSSLEEQYKIGSILYQAMLGYNKRCLVVASGDLSHCLSNDGPYEYHEDGGRFDQKVVASLEKGNPMELIQMDSEFLKNAGQCGLRSYLIGFGVLDGYERISKVYSYEGPFGVGYVTAYLKTYEEKQQTYLTAINDIKSETYEQVVQLEDNYIKLARKSIEHYVKTYEKLDISSCDFPDSFIQAVTNRAGGVFVSIHKEGKLRGCIGTIRGVYDALGDEIIYNAISACSSDPRFPSITEDELESLEIKVDILHHIEAIESEDLLDPKKYGVIVEQEMHRGLLLPNLPGVQTVTEQIDIAKQKAGINPETDYQLFRFQVERHELH